MAIVLPDEGSKMECPNDGIILWRHFTLAKFLDLVVKGSLYFSTVAEQSDKLEGNYYSPKVSSKDDFGSALKSYGAPHPKPDVELSYLLKGISLLKEELKPNFKINCWLGHNSVQAHMWKNYGEIAIKTNVKSIKDAFVNTVEGITIAKVIYGNCEVFSDNFFDFYIYKDESYSSEFEVRLMTYDPESKLGKHIFVELSKLIHEIHISPNSPLFLDSLLKEILQKFNLGSIKVVRSQLQNSFI